MSSRDGTLRLFFLLFTSREHGKPGWASAAVQGMSAGRKDRLLEGRPSWPCSHRAGSRDLLQAISSSLPFIEPLRWELGTWGEMCPSPCALGCSTGDQRGGEHVQHSIWICLLCSTVNDTLLTALVYKYLIYMGIGCLYRQWRMHWYKLAAKHLGIFGVHCMVHCIESCSSVLLCVVSQLLFFSKGRS